MRRREVSAREAATSVLARVAELNPRLNALAEVMAEEALAAADAADAALAAGLALGLLHRVPVTVKVNVDTAGHATTDGVVAAKDHIAAADSPLVAALRREGVRAALRGSLHGLPALDRDQTLELQQRRFSICRDRAGFLEPDAGGHDVLLMPVSWQRQFPVDADKGAPEAMQPRLAAQSPLLGTAMMGLPGLSVPTGLAQGLPVGVQLVAGRFREDRCLAAGQIVEAAARFSALDLLAPR